MFNYKKPAFRVFIVALIAIAVVLIATTGRNAAPAPSPAVSEPPSSPTILSTPSPTPAISAAPTAIPRLSTTASGQTIYKNDDFGISLVFPAEWKDRFVIKDLDTFKKPGDSISVYCKAVYEADDKLGRLFTIVRQTGELITDKDLNAGAVNLTILLRGNGYTYIFRSTSDVQSSDSLKDEYMDLYSKRQDIIKSIAIFGSKTPEASNTGYKVLGTGFFTIEVPLDWELKASANAAVSWDIYSDNSVIGSVQIIPYKSEVIPEDDKTMREYILNDFNDNRSALITLSTKNADQDTMQKIKSGFKLTGGDFTVIDLLSTANRYLELGGIRIFGKIDSLKAENGSFKAINIRAMKYVPDSSTKGFHIEDLNQIITYPIEQSVSIAPLVAPNYNGHGTYEFPNLDSIFVAKYPNYKDMYYDFIIGDNTLKVVLGHYVP